MHSDSVISAKGDRIEQSACRQCYRASYVKASPAGLPPPYPHPPHPPHVTARKEPLPLQQNRQHAEIVSDTCEAVVMIPLTPVLIVKQHVQYGQQDTLEGLHVVNIYGLIHCQADEAEQHPSAMRLHRSYSSLHVMQTACTGHLYLIALHLLLPALMKRSRSKRLRCRPPQPLHQHQRCCM